jgi:hypothetical protein
MHLGIKSSAVYVVAKCLCNNGANDTEEFVFSFFLSNSLLDLMLNLYTSEDHDSVPKN